MQTGSGVNAPVSLAPSPLDAGSYWNWGMRDAALYEANDFLTGTDPWEKADPGDANQDPCRALGTGWRLPTKAELSVLTSKIVPGGTKVKIGGLTGTFGAYTGWVSEDGTKRAVVFIDNGQLLVFPDTGYRDNNSGNILAGTGTYYWSSAASGDDFASALSVHQQNATVLGEYKENGNAIRCVKSSN